MFAHKPLFVIMACLLISAAGLPAAQAVKLPLALLTDNAAAGEPAIHTGVTYEADPPYDNPADSTGRRLVDRDRPAPNWNTTTGINWKDQTVTFDLKGIYNVAKVALLFDMPQQPAYVDIAVRADDTDEWREFGRITPNPEKRGWFEAAVDEAFPARYVKVLFKLKSWGWYLREVKIWGRCVQPGPDGIIPSEKQGDKLVLVKNGEPRCSIIIPAEAPDDVLAAALDLQDYIKRISGATVPVRTDEREWTGTLVLVGRSKFTDRLGVQIDDSYDKPESIVLKTVGSQVVIAGNDALVFQGTQYAVNTLLARLGVGWFGPDLLWQVVPEQKTIVLPPLDIERPPPFEYRSIWRGIGQRWYLGGRPIHCGHAHSRLFPPDKYLEQHPEYYALIDGKRTASGEWQLCTTNADVIRITIEEENRRFDSQPALAAISLSNNDCGGFCQCEICLASGENPGARMLAFANKVARGIRAQHPDKFAVFLAYWYTHAAPKDMKAEPGVAVMVVNSGCHAHALTDPNCERNRNWVENFEKWCATGAAMAIYEWYIPGCSHKFWRRLPWVPGEIAVENLDYWQRRGVRWITYESQYEEGSGYPLRWPLYYVAAKRMWDDSLTGDQILTEACQKLYGPAADPMREYYRVLEEAMTNTRSHSGIWNLPDPTEIYTPEVSQQVRRCLARAQRIAREQDGQVWERVQVDMRIWSRAQRTLEELRQQDKAQVKIWVDGKLYVLDRREATGKYIKAIGGILKQDAVALIRQDGTEQVIGEDETIKLTPGMRFKQALKSSQESGP